MIRITDAGRQGLSVSSSIGRGRGSADVAVATSQHMGAIFIGDLIRLAPAIADLAVTVRNGRYQSWSDVERRLTQHVGPLARSPVLQTLEARRCADEYLRRAFELRDRRQPQPCSGGSA